MQSFDASRAVGAAYTPQLVAYHNNGSAYEQGQYFQMLIRNIGNHVQAVGKEHIEIRVVNHARGADLLLTDGIDSDTKHALDSLRSCGVRFLMCRNTLAERGISEDSLYRVQPDDFVASGVAELAKLQADGYSYIHP